MVRFDCTPRRALVTPLTWSRRFSGAREGETKKSTTIHSALGGMVTVDELAIPQVIDFFTNGLEVIQPQIHNGITNVSDLVYFL